MNLREEFEKETKDQLYYWFQQYAGASMEEHGFSEEYVEWLESKVKNLSITDVVGASAEQLKCSGCKKPLHDGLCGSCCSDLASGNY